MKQERYSDILFIERLGDRPLLKYILIIIAIQIFSFLATQIEGKPFSFYTFFRYIIAWSSLLILLGWGTQYIKKSYTKTIEDLQYKTTVNKTLFKSQLLDKRVWWFFFIVLNVFRFINLYLVWDETLLVEGLIATIISIISWIVIWNPVGADFATEVITVILFSNRIKNQVRIRTLAPDGCGGLSSIGRLCLAVTIVFLAVAALTVITSELTIYAKFGIRFGFVVMIYTISLGTFGVFLFVFPQLFIHTALRKGKQESIDEISNEIERNYGDTQSTNWTRMGGLFSTLYEIRSMRTLPYDLDTLKKLILAIITSLVLPRALPYIYPLIPLIP